MEIKASTTRKKIILAIMDGWGMAKPDKYNAIANAKTPNFDMLKSKYLYTQMLADGENVGLPAGQMGTSEVNHQVIGTGRIEYQELVKINKAIDDQSFFANQVLLDIIAHAKKNKSNIHIAGILSDGGVHSHIAHTKALSDLLKTHNIDHTKIFWHIFTDGRDCAPISAAKYLDQLQDEIETNKTGKIATLQGRVYLDRDREWDRTEVAYQLIFDLKGTHFQDWKTGLEASYSKFDNDQYHEPMVFPDAAAVSDNDSLIFFNFRTDRMHQILERSLKTDKKNVKITAFCKPSKDFDFAAVFEKKEVDTSLAKIISAHNLKQLHITETEKYTHLTYFFNGQRETEFAEEKWELFDSNRYVKPNYNLEPSMRAFDITKEITASIDSNKYDFIAINYPNTDMVGHTGNYEAAVIAAESVDYCIGKLYSHVQNRLDEYALIITADHGNSDEMWDYTNNQPHTQHTLNPVPFIVVTDDAWKFKSSHSQLLSSIAPTILHLMDIPKPVEFEADSVLES